METNKIKLVNVASDDASSNLISAMQETSRTNEKFGSLLDYIQRWEQQNGFSRWKISEATDYH